MNKCIPFQKDIVGIAVPQELNDPFENTPDQLATLATAQLQDYLVSQQDFSHNFGLGGINEDSTQKPIGKMFGVLVVEDASQNLFFLAAFSGKLAEKNNHDYFVPPVYDSLAEGTFLTPGMLALKDINNEIKELVQAGCKATNQLRLLKEKRRAHSQNLQSLLFDSYQFLNATGQSKTPKGIFQTPPAGAGECAAPKLLQYAFQHKLRPVSITEFWWGAPPSSQTNSRIHKHHYPACEDKCRGVLGWMLS